MDAKLWTAIGMLLAVSACADEGGGSTPTTSAAQTGGSGGSGGDGGTAGAGTGGLGGEGGGSGGAPSVCELTQAWQEVDDFVAGVDDDTVATAIAIDGQGIIYVFGNHLGSSESLMRRSDDGGQSWETTAAFACGPPRTIAADAEGTVYVGCTAGNPFHNVVLASSDGGTTFTTVDDFVADPNFPCFAPSLALGLDGALYSAGLCSGNVKHVRSTADGTTWATTHTSTLGSASALIFVAATGDGSVWLGSPGGAWSVLRGDPASMVVVDDTFELAPGKGASVWSLAARGARVYAAGNASDAGDVQHSVLRRRDAAGTWSTLDDVAGTTGAATRVVEAAGGELVYLANDAAGARTRVSADDGQSWQTVDTYALQQGQPASGTDLAADPDGNLFSSYAAADAGGVTHWVVRKMVCR